MGTSSMEHQAEEAECVRMVLDDMGIPKNDGNKEYSLVGRVKMAIDKGPGSQRHMASIGDHLMDLVERLAGVSDCSLVQAQNWITSWAREAQNVSEDVNWFLHCAIGQAGSQRAFADANDVSPQYVADVLKKRRAPGDAILKALGLEKVVIYRKAPTQDPHHAKD